MKVAFVAEIICEGQRTVTMRKEYDLPFMPQVGMKFNCGELGGEPKITDIILCVDSDEAYCEALISRTFNECSYADDSQTSLKASDWFIV